MKVIEFKELDSVRGQGIGKALSFSNHSISTKAVNQHICLVCLLCTSTADIAVSQRVRGHLLKELMFKLAEF